MKETWIDIIGYEGYYQVSNYGRVKSLHRIMIRSNGWKQEFRERILRPYIGGNGYVIVGLTKESKTIQYPVHRLIGINFMNIPDGMVINHLDGNKLNNNMGNLEITTYSGNMIHAYKMGLTPKGDLRTDIKLTDLQVKEIRTKHIPWVYTYKMLAKEYNVSVSLIGYIIANVRRVNYENMNVTVPLPNEKLELELQIKSE